MNSEAVIQQKVRLALGGLPHVRLFRNQCGSAQTKDGRWIKFGLFPGSSDLIGFRTLCVTESMIGARIAVFCGVEIKSPTGTVRPNQIQWRDTVRQFGGIAEILRSTEDARLITEWTPAP